MSILLRAVARFFLAALFVFVLPVQAVTDSEALARGVALRNGGYLQQASDHFRALRAADAQDVAAGGELGASLLQARHYDEAEPLLREAYEKTAGSERARYAIELGNLCAASHRPAEARRFYDQAQMLAGAGTTLALLARINEVRLAAPGERTTWLAAISGELSGVAEPLARARLRLSVGTQAIEAGSVPIAYRNLEEARALAAQAGETRLEVDALDGLAQLYEQQGRDAEALQLSRRAIARAQTGDGPYPDLLLRLEWRQGRLLAAQGTDEEARAAYLRAIAHVESIRTDIPIEYEGGRSSFRDTLEPIYLGLIDLLLKKADTAQGAERKALLLRTRGIAELVKQSELQDYLGERCSVEAAQGAVQQGVETGTAILYPIVLKDRIELLFESGAGIRRHKTPLDAQTLRRLVSSYTGKLRYGEPGYQDEAIQLYDTLIRPFAKEIAEQNVYTLVVVPDGVLRLLPWATLHDGEQFVVQKYAVAIQSGLSMSSQSAARGGRSFSALVAGMAEPGPVVEQLSNKSLNQILAPSASRAWRGRTLGQTRTLFTRLVSERGLRSPEEIASLKEKLALPGVKVEVEALAKILPGTLLLDESFTTARLHDEFEKGKYHIAHLATHGFFGSTADASFIMAYDNLVTMGRLQKLLRLEGVQKTPIDLLTLSACETAEGDDRSPLGIAGAALKANAKSALGSLWSVSDEAAQQLMERFYTGLVSEGLAKGEALRRAQAAMVTHPEMNHPFYWAPFIIVGNWH